MSKSTPTYLRLLTDANESPVRVDEDSARWLSCCEAFNDCTGWRLEFASGAAPKQDAHSMWSAPVAPGVGNTLGHIRIVSRDGDDPAARSGLAKAKIMAAAVGGLWGEVLATRDALWRREAELAAGVPVGARPDEDRHLAERLEAVLGAAAEATRCQAAALYLLDEGTSELKLRASWGMPRRSLLDPARPLRGAAADLEALLGHAVVVTDPRLFEYWKVPRACAAAACVPVSSPTNPLGTLWVFSNDERDFSTAETNMLEVVAGRLAADLEREMLLGEVHRMRTRQPKSTDAAERSPRLPQGVSLDHWDLGGWRSPQHGDSHAWLDWFAVASDQMAFVAGRCGGPSASAAEAATRAAARAASSWDAGPAEAIRRVNAALWALDEGAADVGLAYTKLDTHHGVLRGALGGDVGLAFVAAAGASAKARPRAGSCRQIEASAAGMSADGIPADGVSGDGASRVSQVGPKSLGCKETAIASEHTINLKPGDSLIVWSGPPTSPASDVGKIAAVSLEGCADRSTKTQAAFIGEKLAAQFPGSWATLVLRRR